MELAGGGYHYHGVAGGGQHVGMVAGGGLHGGGAAGGGLHGSGGLHGGLATGGGQYATGLLPVGGLVAGGGDAGCCGSAGVVVLNAGGSGAEFGLGGNVGCGTDCGAVTEMAAGNLAFVGTGRGDFIAETTYKYVGVGRGDLRYAVTARAWWPIILCLALLLVVLVVAFVMVPKPTTTTVVPLEPDIFVPTTVPKVCEFWGDPHVKTFDGGRPSFYGEGEFWILKNPRVMIQGRYAGTKYTLGLASTQKVVISGSFIEGHKIEVEPMDAEFGGSIRVDGNVVLPNFATLTVGSARITYNDVGDLVDQATSVWGKKVVHIELPEGLYMEVFRWANYIDFRIRQNAPLPEGQDGSCGDNDGNALDDTTPAIFSRIGARVSDADCLFTRHTEVHFSPPMQEMLRTKCPTEALSAAVEPCSAAVGESRHMNESPSKKALYNACLFDYCFGQVEHALQVAKEFATPQELKDGGLIK